MRETILSLYALYFVFVCAYAFSNTVKAPEKLELFEKDIIVNTKVEFHKIDKADVCESRIILRKTYRDNLLVSRNKNNALSIFEPVYSFQGFDNQ